MAWSQIAVSKELHNYELSHCKVLSHCKLSHATLLHRKLSLGGKADGYCCQILSIETGLAALPTSVLSQIVTVFFDLGANMGVCDGVRDEGSVGGGTAFSVGTSFLNVPYIVSVGSLMIPILFGLVALSAGE